MSIPPERDNGTNAFFLPVWVRWTLIAINLFTCGLALALATQTRDNREQLETIVARQARAIAIIERLGADLDRRQREEQQAGEPPTQ